VSLTAQVKENALALGADLVGVVAVADLPEHQEAIQAILPGAVSVVVMACRHNPAALGSSNTQVMQLETNFTYEQVSLAAKRVERFLETQGHLTAAVPAFLPVDMSAPKFGLKGEICWRRAAVRAGLGSYGLNGLLVTRDFGAAVRLGGLLTAAHLEPDAPLAESPCDECGACVAACPAQALKGEGKIDKRLCGPRALEHGFNHFRATLAELTGGDPARRESALDGFGLRELWQTFITGNYYYCAQCQLQCPATVARRPGPASS
jgi:epoxyqueuosine reductase QueG